VAEPVVFVRTPPDYREVETAVRRAVEALGGISRFARPGERILIKPNLLAPTRPGQAVVTHPAVFAAVARLVIEAGAKPLVGDSPPGRSLGKLMEKTGHMEAARRLGVELLPFRESVSVPVPGPFRKIEVSREAMEVDGIINLPKLKTHGQMLMTLAVKNTFGCIVGMRKPQWHFRAGVDAELFASVVVGAHLALAPRLNILDGVLAMEGDGPGTGGTPRALGWIVAAADGTAVDWAVAEALGIDPLDLPTIRFAESIGRQARPRIEGEIEHPRRFRLPGEKDLLFGPRLLHRFLRRRLTARPRPIAARCIGCGECVKYCPAGAMEVPRSKGPVAIDDDRCIRCYCCLEVCPHGAMKLRRGWLRGTAEPPPAKPEP